MRPQLAREIIFAIGDNMREGLEPLLTKTLAPSLYQVYLHADDYDRLRGIFGEIESQAKSYLDGELEKLNQRSAPALDRLRDRLPMLAGRTPEEHEEPPVRHEPAGGEWHIRFQEDPNDQLEPGEVEVVSELAVGEEAGYGSGRKTQRIAVSTTRKLQQSTTARQTLDDQPAVTSATSSATNSAASEAPTVPTPPVAESGAYLEFTDRAGTHRFVINKDEIVVGRGAVDVWVDLRLDTLPDVSRRHLRIRRDPASGRYWAEDLSQFGTRVDGKPAPPGRAIELADGARLDLADVVTMTFHQQA